QFRDTHLDVPDAITQRSSLRANDCRSPKATRARTASHSSRNRRLPVAGSSRFTTPAPPPTTKPPLRHLPPTAVQAHEPRPSRPPPRYSIAFWLISSQRTSLRRWLSCPGQHQGFRHELLTADHEQAKRPVRVRRQAAPHQLGGKPLPPTSGASWPGRTD